MQEEWGKGGGNRVRTGKVKGGGCSGCVFAMFGQLRLRTRGAELTIEGLQCSESCKMPRCYQTMALS